MIRFRERHPLLASLLVLAAMLAGMLIGGIIGGIAMVIPPLEDLLGEYGIQLVVELCMLAVMVGITFLMRMSRVFTCRGRGFWKSMIPAAVILGFYAVAGLESLVFCVGSPLQRPMYILLFVLCMAAVGITEELTFRGLIAGILYDKYGATPAGVWLSVVASSLLFGVLHLSNAVGGAADLSGVLIQMVGAIALGMCLAALYFRCRNLWAVAAVHGFMDFCALLSSGIFRADSMTDIIDGYSAANLLGFVLYAAIALVLLRPSKMREITSQRESDVSTTVKLGISTGLVGILVGAVVVLSLI